jgi:hypothetical protein
MLGVGFAEGKVFAGVAVLDVGAIGFEGVLMLKVVVLARGLFGVGRGGGGMFLGNVVFNTGIGGSGLRVKVVVFKELVELAGGGEFPCELSFPTVKSCSP